MKVDLSTMDIEIPGEVMFDPDLTMRERMLYGLLGHLGKKSPDGYVYSSNAELAGMLGVVPQIASNAIAKLRKKGFLTVEYKVSDGEGVAVFREYSPDRWSKERRLKVREVAQSGEEN